MNKSSEERLSKVHPEFARRVRLAIDAMAAQGHTIEVVSGYRSYDEQNRLYAQGRTAPGKIVTKARGGYSNHNFALACDLCPFVNGKPQWDAPDSVWDAIRDAAESVGLESGARWKFVDRPHVQLTCGLSLETCRALYERGGLVAVWEEASKRIA